MGRYGHGMVRRPSSEDRRIAAEALEKVGMAEFAQRQLTAVGWTAAARIFGPCACPRCAHLHDGRTICGSRCGN